MSDLKVDVEISQENRLCEVAGKLGYFQCWEQYSTVIDASPMIGGHPGGIVSKVFAIVEFKNGCKRVEPEQLRFCDEKNDMLGCLNRSTNS